MKTLDFREINGGLPFYMLVGFIGVFVLAGLSPASVLRFTWNTTVTG
jgi:hypothetical protein